MTVTTNALAAYAVLLQLADDEAHANRALDLISEEPTPPGFEAQIKRLRHALNQTRQEKR